MVCGIVLVVVYGVRNCARCGDWHVWCVVCGVVCVVWCIVFVNCII